MRNIIILTVLLSLVSLPIIFGQCNATPDDLGLITVKGGPNGQVTIRANSTLTYDVGLFGTLLVEVPVSTTDASISGASAVGLHFLQFFNSEDVGMPAGKKYAFFTSATAINPMVLFPMGTDVVIGTVTTVPASNLTTSSIVLTDLIPPVNNGGTYAYYKTAVQVCNMNNFNDNLIADASNSALPIELTNFTARKDKGTAILSWTTETEINNEGFEVEKSLDGKNFSKLGWVEGNGDSNSPITYGFVDDHLDTGINYYRLKSVDYDGLFYYSEIRSLVGEREELAYTISPNPSNGEVVNITGTGNKEFKIEIFSIGGKKVFSQFGLSTEMDFTMLENGLYMISISQGTNLKVINWVKN